MKPFLALVYISQKHIIILVHIWRTAFILGAKFIFIIDGKYKPQSSDTTKAWSKIPFYRYDDFDHFYKSLPYATRLVGVEMDEKSEPITTFVHPTRAAYLLGSEDNGLPKQVIERCHNLFNYLVKGRSTWLLVGV